MDEIGPKSRIAFILCGVGLMLLSGWMAIRGIPRYLRNKEKAPTVDWESLKPFYTEAALRKDLYDALAAAALCPLAAGLVVCLILRRGFAYHHLLGFWMLKTGLIAGLRSFGRGEWWMVGGGAFLVVYGLVEWITCLIRHTHRAEKPATPASLP